MQIPDRQTHSDFMSKVTRYILLLLIAVIFLPAVARAQDEEVDDDFVIASLLIADPGDVLISRLGHAAIHMRCPDHNLDYVFTYESESILEKPFAFLSDNLKMGMAALSPEEYLETFKEEKRGVKEYELNLPIEVKRNLWRVLDGYLMKGMDLKYDYLERGCAHSALMMIKEGLGNIPLKYGTWSDEYNWTRREVAHYYLADDQWTRLFLHFLCNGVIDDKCSKEQKVIIPAQLPDVLAKATVNGQPVINKDPVTIIESTPRNHQWFTPLCLAFIILALTILCIFLKSQIMDYVLLALQAIIGILTIYLVFFSSLVCTEWSWLIIPFNPLPLIFWRWRKYWSLPFAGICLIWAAVMAFWPHILTDWAFIVTALAIVLSNYNIFKLSNNR